jgi:hypothetical protein
MRVEIAGAGGFVDAFTPSTLWLRSGLDIGVGRGHHQSGQRAKPHLHLSRTVCGVCYAHSFLLLAPPPSAEWSAASTVCLGIEAYDHASATCPLRPE